jgi:hypothetical protein
LTDPSVNVTDIAARYGVSRTTIYKHADVAKALAYAVRHPAREPDIDAVYASIKNSDRNKMPKA